MSVAHDEQLWPSLVGFAAELDEPTQRLIADVIAASDELILEGLLAAVEEAGLERESLLVVAQPVKAAPS